MDQHIHNACLLYTSDAADERSSVDLGGRRIIKKKKIRYNGEVLTEVVQTTTQYEIQHINSHTTYNTNKKTYTNNQHAMW